MAESSTEQAGTSTPGTSTAGKTIASATTRGAIDVDEYLRRIGYEGPRTPTAETLRAVHHAHRLAVPYENLDVALGRPISHQPEAIFEKIVHRRRGGWCHELNRLFALLLEGMGFPVHYHSARVWDSPTQTAPDFSHLVLVVPLEERWVADVGFGARGPLIPLRIDDPGEQSDGTAVYRVEADPPDERKAFQQQGAEWAPLFAFSLQQRTLAEFEPRYRQQQTEPSWTGRRMVTIATSDGRISLNDLRLVTTSRRGREERLLASDDEWRAELRSRFGIELDEPRTSDA